MKNFWDYRINWLNHLDRMEDHIPKKIFKYIP